MPDPTWAAANFESALPEGFSDIADAVSTAVSTVQTILEAVQTMFEVVRAFIVDRIDLLEAAVSSLRDIVQSMIEDLEGGGVYLLHNIPRTMGVAVSPSAWMTQAAGSVIDPGDPDRPNFASITGMAGSVMLVAGADYNNVTSTFAQLISALVKPVKYKESYRSLADIQQEYIDEPRSTGDSKAPDWERSTAITDAFPFLGKLRNLLKKLLGLFTYSLGLTTIIDAFIAGLDVKIGLCNAIHTELEDLALLFTALTGLSGIYVLPFAGNWTSEEFKQVLLDAGVPVGLEGSDMFAAGCVILMAGVPTGTAQLVLGLIGALPALIEQGGI